MRKIWAGNRAVGGGVSIVYDKSRCSFRERKISGNHFELVAAIGKVGKLARQVALFCIYIQPKMRVAELQELYDLINAEIILLKTRSDPLIMIGGDLNRRSLDDCLADFPDIKRVNFDPTRGTACLDVVHSNANSMSSTVWPPLETQNGIPSDHSCVVLAAKEEVKKNFKWITKQSRAFTVRGTQLFGAALLGTNWDSICPEGGDPDALVTSYQEYIATLTDRFFPLRKSRQRSNEPLWVTEGIRRLAKLKRRVFKREKKSALWKRLRDDLLKKMEESKTAFVNKIESSGSTKAYYSAIKALSTCDKPQEWDVMSLYPDCTVEEAGDNVASYFTRISDLFEPLSETGALPTQRRPVTEDEVLKCLADAKKPASAVRGDMLPSLMKQHFAKVVKPITRIFNSVFRTASWPKAWKEETTVIIPKNPSPAELSECRNISCTAFLSKVLEGILLNNLREEIDIDESQYGGIKKCSVDHMLIDLYEAVLNPLENGHPTAILSIDYEKAFNRLNHKECLLQLRNLGASTASLSLIRSFLTKRSMRVRIADSLSQPRLLKGGSPQGSILGCCLYCATTQQIGADLAREGGQIVAEAPSTRSPPPDRVVDNNHVPVADPGFELMEALAPEAMSSDDSFVTAEGPDLTPPEFDNTLDSSDQGQEPPLVVKYVDDTTVVSTLNKDEAIRHISSAAPSEIIPAPVMEHLMSKIVERSDSIGMVVNCKKTQLVLISSDNGYCSSSSIRVGPDIIASKDHMKLLGFMVGNNGMSDQVNYIKTRFRRKFWSLIHLRRSGISGDRLYRLYAIMIRPVIEANAIVYHSMLTRTQAHDLEKLQKRAIRVCYGNFTSYVDVLQARGLESLESRRLAAIRRFVGKTLDNNPRFRDKWFRRREEVRVDLRNRRPIIETQARTSRYQNSPLLFLQRMANDLLTRRT